MSFLIVRRWRLLFVRCKASSLTSFFSLRPQISPPLIFLLSCPLKKAISIIDRSPRRRKGPKMGVVARRHLFILRLFPPPAEPANVTFHAHFCGGPLLSSLLSSPARSRSNGMGPNSPKAKAEEVNNTPKKSSTWQPLLLSNAVGGWGQSSWSPLCACANYTRDIRKEMQILSGCCSWAAPEINAMGLSFMNAHAASSLLVG